MSDTETEAVSISAESASEGGDLQNMQITPEGWREIESGPAPDDGDRAIGLVRYDPPHRYYGRERVELVQWRGIDHRWEPEGVGGVVVALHPLPAPPSSRETARAMLAGPSEPTEPVAWRVKDFGGGSLLFISETAARSAAGRRGSVVEPLYTTSASEIARLNAENADLIHDPVSAACQRLGNTVICRQCGATGLTYGIDTCSAPFDRSCEGFKTVEHAAYGTRRTGDQAQ